VTRHCWMCGTRGRKRQRAAAVHAQADFVCGSVGGIRSVEIVLPPGFAIWDNNQLMCQLFMGGCYIVPISLLYNSLNAT